MGEFTRVAVASRAFSLAAILGLQAAISRNSILTVALMVVGIAAVASYVSFVSAVPSHWVIAGEATFASLAVVAALPDSVLLLPYLVVLPLLAGLARGLRGASLVVVPQLAAISAVAAASGGLDHLRAQAELLAPWALTIAGAGLLGAWARKMGKSPAGSTLDEKYDSARRLLGQLRNLARRLPSGLDPVTIASQMLETIEEHTGRGRSAVFTRTKGGVFAPLAYRGVGARESLDANDELIGRAWSTASAVSKALQGEDAGVHSIVLPLRLGSEMVGVVATQVPREVPPASLDALQRQLDDLSLRLATALAFDDVRNLVTADERQRLAREIHDGVAQEVASLGYVVDELAALSHDHDVSAGLMQLRSELSRVVSDLRLSIFDLRSDLADGAGLGAALSEYVRKVGAQSSMTVHLSLDEAPVRLRPGIESELFRIAQEAITNARKHSRAENLWVDCWVRPPSALLRVRDDGDGIRGGRPDSYGLRIMQERADRIDARLAIQAARPAPGKTGTSVTVSVGRDLPVALEGIEAAS